MTIAFRDSHPGDSGALDRIFRTSFCATFAHLYRAQDLEAFLSGFGLDNWEEQLADPSFVFRIAQLDGVPIGFVKLGPLKLPVAANGPAMLLDQLYVLDRHHGNGIGRKLLDWAIDESRRRGAAELYLTVYVDNHRARRLYEHNGFEAVGRYDFMVGSHADEDIIMRKALGA